MSGLKTGITIAVYAINRETGDRREIKPKRHFDGEKLHAESLPRRGYEPCLCPQCKGNN